MIMNSVMILSVSSFFSTSIKLGLIFCIMTLGVHISFRILDMADLSIEGTFPLGACITALIISINFASPALNAVKPVVATLLALVGGGIGGLITGLLTTKCKIPAILSGIITMTGLYSINLAILGLAKKNVITLASLPIDTDHTIFAYLVGLFQKMNLSLYYSRIFSTMLICVIIALLVFILVYRFFGTEYGMSLRATGDNEAMATAQGINTSKAKIIGLVISNALIALAGSLFAQNNGAANVTSGRGMIVIGLASIVIGEIIFGRKSYSSQLISIVVGTMIYYFLRGIAIELDFEQFLDLISAILIVVILVLPLIKSKIVKKKALKGGPTC